MKKVLLIILLVVFAGFGAQSIAQNAKLVVPIVMTGVIEDEGIKINVSSDDAEQENDEMDALDDDDIDCGWEGEAEDLNTLTCGLRFQNITIPKGATIDSAFIYVTSHEVKEAEWLCDLDVYGIAEDNPYTFTLDELITDRPATNTVINWQVEEYWDLWGEYRTIDLKDIVQELVDRGGWQSGNSMAFVFKGKDQGIQPASIENAREFESFENIADPEEGGDGQNHPERVPRFEVYFSVGTGTLVTKIQMTGIIEDEGIQVKVSSDDAEQENDGMDALDDDDIDCGWEGEAEDLNTLTCGLRFQNIAIPKGSTINSAMIYVTSHEVKEAEWLCDLDVYGIAEDDPYTFTLDELITDRPATNTVINWQVEEYWDLWGEYHTIDLKDIVQELIDRQGWECGNAMAFVFKGKDQGVQPASIENAREFESFENIADPEEGGDGQNHPERVPRLEIEYTMGMNSVKEVYVDKALNVFPNPSKDVFTIEFEETARADVYVFDQIGNIVLTHRFDVTDRGQINLGEFPAGMYLIKAVQDGKAYTQKVVVE